MQTHQIYIVFEVIVCNNILIRDSPVAGSPVMC